jgi:DNA topoisomerase-1
MASNLLIVESPAKAKTIEKILGQDFVVKSCFGHIRDLPSHRMGIDIEKGFVPEYEVPKDKSTVIKELKKLASTSEVWLATDEDREGEAISWHLCEVLGLNPQDTKRIVFNEITAPAIKKAVGNPRLLDLNLVNAQQARRVLDRIVGFELSPVLWKKLGNRKLSAGRVQSVAVRLVVEREREVNNFQATFAFKVTAFFSAGGRKFKAELNHAFLTDIEAEAFLNHCSTAQFNVKDITVKPAYKSPAPPFTTSTLQQEAGRKLGFSVKKTMSVAQRLYEAGHITYMRTDSVNLSEMARNTIADYVKTNFGDKYSYPQQYFTKNSSAQEAHEAIRPTYITHTGVEGARDEQRLYELIWKRTLASQMSKASLERTIVNIDISANPHRYIAEGEVILFDGFLKVYMESNDEEESDEKSGILPKMDVGQSLALQQAEARQRYSQPPPRYTEASLVKKLEELGIGRPSTYAPTISTIVDRGYVRKDTREGSPRPITQILLKNGNISKDTLIENTGSLKGKLVPEDIGFLVNDYLVENFGKVLDFKFTANMENDFDHIAEGHQEWTNTLQTFYKPFHKNVEESLSTTVKVTGERILGDDPQSGKPVIAKLGRYGPMIQIGTVEDEEKPRYAKLMTGQSIETISLEEAMTLFQLPRIIGEHNAIPLKTNQGRFGPYLQYDKVFVNISPDEIYSLTLEQALEKIEAKKQAEQNKIIAKFGEIEILNGRFGPYIKQGKNNYKIPKGRIPAELSEEDCNEIITEAQNNPKPTNFKKGKK